jgi:uncharacterized repeat protein (TIGR03833 family)
VLDGRKREDVKIGTKVRIVEKRNQNTEILTEGVVKQVLTSSALHPHGIKVLLENGSVGRVKEIIENKNKPNQEIVNNLIKLPLNEDQNTEFKATFRFDLKRFQYTGVSTSNKEVEKSISKTVAAFMNAKEVHYILELMMTGRYQDLKRITRRWKNLIQTNSD